MTRREEILNKAIEFVDNSYTNVGIKTTHEASVAACQEIAEWADANPNEQVIAKYLYEKKGYPIDLNGNIPSFEDTMKDVKLYDTYKRKQFIERACNWMNDNAEDYITGRWHDFDTTSFVLAFKQAMEE